MHVKQFLLWILVFGGDQSRLDTTDVIICPWDESHHHNLTNCNTLFICWTEEYFYIF